MSEAIFDARNLSSLGALADAEQYQHPIETGAWEKSDLLKFLEQMLLIRKIEEQVGILVEKKEALCPCHLGIGQEAVAVGVSSNLNKDDAIFGAHRSHAHYLALGGDVKQLAAEILGKFSGCSHGLGGSMHLYSPEIGFHGSVPIVGATIPIAVGAAMAKKMQGGANIAVSYFGDGACEEGIFHEAMNLAAIQKAPILFVCENNLYSSHMDIKLRQPADVTARFGVAHRIPSLVVDGNDVVAVAKATAELVERTRTEGGPGFLEAVTYRQRGHVGPDENLDVGVRRKVEHLVGWKKRDPIKRLYEAMLKSQMISEADYSELDARVDNVVADAISFAREAPYPDPNMLLDIVYSAGGAA